MTLGFEKAIYYFLMFLMSAIIVLSLGFVYLYADGKSAEQPIPEELRRAEEAGQKKNLPDYMLETLKSDELEQLKP